VVVVIVTGGSHGPGLELVRTIAGRGYAIVVVYLDDQRSAEAAVEEIFAAGGAAVAVRADVTDDLDVERLFEEAIAAFGGVDAVIHTTTDSASVLERHAARKRDIPVIAFPPEFAAAGVDGRVADLVSLLEHRRRRPTS
jgi:NAD(P)-dependent dehydrogenase (short-subunit alcohol dehydrogenase family)